MGAPGGLVLGEGDHGPEGQRENVPGSSFCPGQDRYASGAGPREEAGGSDCWVCWVSGSHSQAWGSPENLTLQGLLGCELGPNNLSVPVAKFALNGEEFMQFVPKDGNWTGEWPEAEAIRQKWAEHPDILNKEKTFLLYSCPQRLLSHLEIGRENLEWKGEHPGAPGSP